jgi:hypothetical protein
VEVDMSRVRAFIEERWRSVAGPESRRSSVAGSVPDTEEDDDFRVFIGDYFKRF